MFLKKIQDKFKESRIDLILINESYTSSIYPLCKMRVNLSDMNSLCTHCGYEQDRDVIGSINP
ncbi:MAG: transposase [Candidatus Lokiarchaeota archaeon]|nr:transposase [Candidatus Lokiarchaeota archaeon]